MKRLDFSRRSEFALEEITVWSAGRFGEARTRVYIQGLLQACHALAAGRLSHYSCSQHIAADLRKELRFARKGRHFIIFTETAASVQIVDFIYQSADVGGRLGGTET